MTTSTSLPRVSAAARKYVSEVLEFGFHNTTGPGINQRLERQFAEKFNRKFAISHCNGTATMQSCLMAAGVGAGDEVIVPSLTMASTALVALHVNATPIFADIDPDTFTIDPKDVDKKITPRTKAIIPVSIYGLSMDMDPLMALAKKHNLTVIEDNAQCFLGKYKGKLVGTLGHAASFSFQGSKHMTCGDGGIVVTDDEALATEVRRAAVLGYSAVSCKPGASSISEELRCHPTFARHTHFGYNFRLPEIAAAVALGELERLDELVAMRVAVKNVLKAVTDDCKWLTPQKTPDGYEHSYWAFTCKINDDAIDWAAFRKRYKELGGDGFYGCWLPVHKEPFFQQLGQKAKTDPKRYPQFAGVMPDYRDVHLPVVEKIQPRLVQFKTNYFDLDIAKREADMLNKAIRDMK